MTTRQPAICGREREIKEIRRQKPAPTKGRTMRGASGIQSCFSCALHMHQPTIPAGQDNGLISNLQYMFEHPGEGDNHNANAFASCYRRMADLIPELLSEGCDPKIMLDYSGNLLWGFEQMQRNDILEALTYLTCDPVMQRHVEWLGTFWGHAVAPSTPAPDLKLHITAWQQHFSALFGDAALKRVRGFSLPEMSLPNHPDSLYALITSLREGGYEWLLIQEHTVEQLTGLPLSDEQKYHPNRLVARNSLGVTAEIDVLVKTQGSDTKLVGQMQPCFEAIHLAKENGREQTITPIVTQIADGENGGVMMNEFPEAFRQAHRRIRDDNSSTVAMNGSEYFDWLSECGIHSHDYPTIQAIKQHQLSEAIGDQDGSIEATEAAIETLKKADPSFSMEGSSWTNDISWVKGYDQVLNPIHQLSADFHQRFDSARLEDASITASEPYHQSLLHLLVLETSCFRYWGEGIWTDYAQTISARLRELIHQEEIPK